MAATSLLGVARKDFSPAEFIKGDDRIGLDPASRNLHAGRANRHPGYGDPRDGGTLGDQPPNHLCRYVSFYDVAIDDGCVARLELSRHPVTGLDPSKVPHVLRFDAKPVFLEIIAPGAAAASKRRFEDRDFDRSSAAPCICIRGLGVSRANDQSKKQSRQQ